MARRYRKNAGARKRLLIERLEDRVLLNATVWGWGEIENSATGGGIPDDFADSTHPVTLLAEFNPNREAMSQAMYPDGIVYVAWEVDDGNNTDVAWKTWDGESWSDTNYVGDLLPGGNYLGNPKLIQTAQNDVYMTFESYDSTVGLWDVYLYQLKGPDYNLQYEGETDAGTPILSYLDLSVPQMISVFDNDTSDARHPGIGADVDGNAYVVWQDDFLGYPDIFGFFGVYEEFGNTQHAVVWHDLQTDTNIESSVVVESANLNGDNYNDLVIGNYGTSDVSVVLGGAAGFSQPIDYEAGLPPTGLTLADLDGDNDPDIIVLSTDMGQMTVLTNAGDGTFGAPSAAMSIGIMPTDIAVGNLDTTNGVDIAVAVAGTGQVSVYSGGNNGTFTFSASYGVSPNPVGVVIADFNNDTANDIAVASMSGGVTFLYGGVDAQGAPTGAFSNPVTVSVGFGLSDIVTINYDNDTDIDIALINEVNGTLILLDNDVVPLVGSQWTILTSASGMPFASELYTANLNGDTFTDLVVFGGATVYTFVGDGTSAYIPTNTLVSIGANPVDIAVGNLGGFGLALDDIAVLNEGDPFSDVEVFINSGGLFLDGVPDYTVLAGDDQLPGIAGPEFGNSGAYRPEVGATSDAAVVVVWQDVPFDSADPNDPVNRAQASSSDLFSRDIAHSGDNNGFAWDTWRTDPDADATLITPDWPGFNPSMVSGESSVYLAYESVTFGVYWAAGGRIHVQEYSGGWSEVSPGSAYGEGISLDPFSIEPTPALDPDGNLLVAWSCGRTSATNDDYEIYLRRYIDSEWNDVGFRSSSYTGISFDGGDSHWPSITIGQNDGQIYVVWEHSPPNGTDSEVFLKTRSTISEDIAWAETVNGVQITIYTIGNPGTEVNVAVGQDNYRDGITDILIDKSSKTRRLSGVYIYDSVPGLGIVFENDLEIRNIQDMTITRTTSTTDTGDGTTTPQTTGGVDVVFIASQGPIANITIGGNFGGGGTTTTDTSGTTTTTTVTSGGQELNSECIGSGWITPLDIDNDLLGSELVVERLGILRDYGGSREDTNALYMLGSANALTVNGNVGADLYLDDVKTLTIVGGLLGDLHAGYVKTLTAGPVLGSRFELSGPLDKMTVASFTDGFIRADELGKIVSAGDFGPQLESRGGLKELQVLSGLISSEYLQVGDSIGKIEALGNGTILSIYALPDIAVDLKSIKNMGYFQGDIVVDGKVGTVDIMNGDGWLEDIRASQLKRLSVSMGQLFGERYEVSQKITKIEVVGGGFRMRDMISSPYISTISVEGGDFAVEGHIEADVVKKITVKGGGLLNEDADPTLIDEYPDPVGGPVNPYVEVKKISVNGGDLTGDMINVSKLSRIDVKGGDMIGGVDALEIGTITVKGSDIVGNLTASQGQIKKVQADGSYSGQMSARTKIGTVDLGGSFSGSVTVTDGALSKLDAGLGIAGNIAAVDVGSVKARNGSFDGTITATQGSVKSLEIANGDFIGDANAYNLFNKLTIKKGDLLGDVTASGVGTIDVEGSVVDDGDGQPTLSVTNNVKSFQVSDGDVSDVTFDVGGLFGTLSVKGGDFDNVVVIAEVLDKAVIDSRQSGGNIAGTSFIISDYFGMLDVKGDATNILVNADIMKTLQTGGRLESAFVNVSTLLTELKVGADLVMPEINAGELRSVNVTGAILGGGPDFPVTPPYYVQAQTGAIEVRGLNVPDSPQVVSVGFPLLLDNDRVIVQVVPPTP